MVVGGGLLDALEIREVNDIDICVAPEVLKKFKDKNGWRSSERWRKTFLKKKEYDMFSELAWEDCQTTREEAIRTAEYINGVPFLNIQETIKFKKALGRDKDFQDIELLEMYLKEK